MFFGQGNDFGRNVYFGNSPFIFERREVPQQSFTSKLFTILPLILLFALSIYIQSSENNYGFDTVYSRNYPIKRELLLPKNVKLTYYVKQSFQATKQNIYDV